MIKLKRSHDRKVTNLVSPNGKTSKIANTFGLPAGRAFSCPDATDYCETICYAGKLEKVYKGVRNVLTFNLDTLKNGDMVELLDDMINDFEAECDKRIAPKLFRIHWDGDLFSDDYTNAWIKTIQSHPNVRFWIYTRVVNGAVKLHKAKLNNLALYFSGDPDNITIANMLNRTYGINIAMVAETFEAGRELLKTPAVNCPENNKAIPLINTKGSACVTCGLCIRGERSVIFSRSKK